jgi:hypothetical protein
MLDTLPWHSLLKLEQEQRAALREPELGKSADFESLRNWWRTLAEIFRRMVVPSGRFDDPVPVEVFHAMAGFAGYLSVGQVPEPISGAPSSPIRAITPTRRIASISKAKTSRNDISITSHCGHHFAASTLYVSIPRFESVRPAMSVTSMLPRVSRGSHRWKENAAGGTTTAFSGTYRSKILTCRSILHHRPCDLKQNFSRSAARWQRTYSFDLMSPLQRRQFPGAVQGLRFRPVETHRCKKRSLRRRQPVGFLGFAWRVMLEIERDATVCITDEIR